MGIHPNVLAAILGSGGGASPQTLRYGVGSPAAAAFSSSTNTLWIPHVPCRQTGALTGVSVHFSTAGNYKLVVLRKNGYLWDEVYKSASRSATVGVNTLTASDFGTVNMLPGDIVGIFCSTARISYSGSTTYRGAGHLVKVGESTETGNALTAEAALAFRFEMSYSVSGVLQVSDVLFSETFAHTDVPWDWKHAGTAWTYGGGKAVSSATGVTQCLEYRYSLGNLSQWTWVTKFTFDTEGARFAALSQNYSQTGFGSIAELRQDTGDLVIYEPYQRGTLPAVLSTNATGISFATGTEYKIEITKAFRTKTITVSNPAVPAQTYSKTLDEENGASGGANFPSGNFYGQPSFTAMAGTISVLESSFALPSARPDVLIIGDSIAEGSGVTSSSLTYGRLLAAARGWSIQTFVQGGATTVNAGQRMGAGLAHLVPKRVVLALGTNDTATADWQARMAAWLDYWQGLGATVIVPTVPAESADANPENVMNPHILAQGWPTVRHDLALTSPATGLGVNRNGALYFDTLHPNSAGHAAMHARWSTDQP